MSEVIDWGSQEDWDKHAPGGFGRPLPERADEEPPLGVGDTLELGRSLRLLIPHAELRTESDPDELWKPRTFDEWIRSRLNAPTFERLMNAEFEKRGETTRVAVDVCEVLSTRAAASERPDLYGGNLAVQRAEIRAVVRVTHNSPLTWGLLLTLCVLAISTVFTVRYLTQPTVDDDQESWPAKIGRAGADLVTGASKGLGPVLLGALAVLLFWRR